MNKLFIDTWGWLTLADAKEKQHTQVVELMKTASQSHVALFTSQAVLDETITLLFRRLSPGQALELMERILGLEELKIIALTSDRFQKTVALRKQYLDQGRISFTDLSSCVIMDEYDIQHVLSEDHHFEIVHFGFCRLT